MTRGVRRSINASKRDEQGAAPRYERLADRAEATGDTKTAQTYREIAKDERRHLKMLRRL